MATTKAIIDVSINTGDAAAQLRNLQNQINAFNAALNKNNVVHAYAAKEFATSILEATNLTQAFTAEQVRMETASRRLDQTLSKGRGTIGQYFNARFRKDSADAAAVLSLANARAQALETQFIKTTGAVGGFREAIAITPLAAFNSEATVANEKLAIHRAMLRQATTSMINFGKNTQWAGRQLMVGFTVPLTIFGAAAGKTFQEIEQASVRLRKVYGDAFTPPEEIEQNMKAVEGLALEFTKYGIAVKDTIGLAAEAAAAGAQNADLIAATTEATRLATLGQMEQQEALTATIALQNSFRLSSEQLATEVNFLNMVENQTVVTLQDLAQAIPRVAPVIVGLGGDVRDMAAMLAAMQEGGVSAAQGANALKSGLGSLINPTEKASKVLAQMGININGIVQANRGDLMGTVQAFAQALSGLDKFTRQQALEELFGKYQYARLGALFDNIIKDGTQAARVLQLAGMSAQDMAKSAEKELGVISEATSTKYMAAIERFKMSIAPLGEMFMKISTPIINFFSKLFEMFDKLPDGVKNLAAIGTIIVGIVIPAGTMFLGLLMNLIGTLTKFGHIVGVAMKGLAQGGLAGAVQAVSQSLRYMSLEEINAAGAAQQLGESTVFANNALLGQVTRANNAEIAILRLKDAYHQLIQKQMQMGTMSPELFQASMAAGSAAESRGRTTRVVRRNKGGAIYINNGNTVPGFGNTDTVPAMLTPGEFVVNKQATAENLPLLHAINDGKKMSGFNKGGKIPGVQYFGTRPGSYGGGQVSDLPLLQAIHEEAMRKFGLTGTLPSQSRSAGLRATTGRDYQLISEITDPSVRLAIADRMRNYFQAPVLQSLSTNVGLARNPRGKKINQNLRRGFATADELEEITGLVDYYSRTFAEVPAAQLELGKMGINPRKAAEMMASALPSRIRKLRSKGLLSDEDLWEETRLAFDDAGLMTVFSALEGQRGAIRYSLPETIKKSLSRGSQSIHGPALESVFGKGSVRIIGGGDRPVYVISGAALGYPHDVGIKPGLTEDFPILGTSYQGIGKSETGWERIHASPPMPLMANGGGLIPGIQYFGKNLGSDGGGRVKKLQKTHTTPTRILTQDGELIPERVLGSSRGKMAKALAEAGVPIELLTDAWILSPLNQGLKRKVQGKEILSWIDTLSDGDLGPAYRRAGITAKGLGNELRSKFTSEETYDQSEFGTIVESTAKTISHGKFEPSIDSAYLPGPTYLREIETKLRDLGFSITEENGRVFIEKTDKSIKRQLASSSYPLSRNKGGLIPGIQYLNNAGKVLNYGTTSSMRAGLPLPMLGRRQKVLVDLDSTIFDKPRGNLRNLTVEDFSLIQKNVDRVNELRANGIDVEFVTARPPELTKLTQETLKKFGLDDIPVTYNDMQTPGKKDPSKMVAMPAPEYKVAVAKKRMAEGYDVSLLDDDENNRKLMAENGIYAFFNKGGMIPGIQYLNAAGMVGKTFLGMPHSFNPKIATRYSALARSDELLKSGRWADMPVSDIGTQVTSIGGFSSTLPGINGVYEIDGKRFVIKAHETPESALAESRSSQLMRDLFGLESPEQEFIKFRHPQTGQLVSGVRSPYDERFASSASAISPDSFVRQLIASAIRRDSDLQPDNLWNNVLADSGAAILGVSATGKPSAMTDRAITTSPRAVSEQVDINLLKTKGGAKKWFAEESANIARNMTEDEYVGGILQEIARLRSRLNSSVDMLPFGTPEEKAMYRTILERDLAELEAYDWRSTYQHHVGLYPEAKKPPTAAAIAKKEKEAQEKARQLGANARMKYGIPWVNKGGLIPGLQYFANAGIVKRLMNSGLDRGQLERKLVSDNQWDDLDDDLKRQVREWDAAGNTGFGIFGAAARAKQQPSKKAEKKSGAYSPLKTIAMTDIDFGDVSGLLRLMRGGEFDEADQAFLIDYIKEGLDYGRLKDFHPQARQYHGEYYDTAMSSLVTEAQRIGNPKLIEALVRLTGIQAKNSGGLIQRLIGGGPALSSTTRKTISTISARKAAAQKLQKYGFNSLSDEEKLILRESAQNVGSMPLFKGSSLISPDIDDSVRQAIVAGREEQLIGRTINTPFGSYSSDERIARPFVSDNYETRMVQKLAGELFTSTLSIKENGRFRKPKTGREAVEARKAEVGKLPLHLDSPMMTEAERRAAWFNWKGIKEDVWNSSMADLEVKAQQYDEFMKKGAGKGIVYRLRPSSTDLPPGQSRVVGISTSNGITTITLETGKMSATPITKIGGAPIMPGGNTPLNPENEWFVSGFNQGGMIPGVQYLMAGARVRGGSGSKRSSDSKVSAAQQVLCPGCDKIHDRRDCPYKDILNATSSSKFNPREIASKLTRGELHVLTDVIEDGSYGEFSSGIKSVLRHLITYQTDPNNPSVSESLIKRIEKKYGAGGRDWKMFKLVKSAVSTGDEELIDLMSRLFPSFTAGMKHENIEERAIAALMGPELLKNKGGMIPLQYFSNGGDVAAIKAFATRPLFESANKTMVPGYGNTDTVPAALTPGEFVINKQATAKNLPLLHAINNGQILKRNKGGQIPNIQYLMAGSRVKPKAPSNLQPEEMIDWAVGEKDPLWNLSPAAKDLLLRSTRPRKSGNEATYQYLQKRGIDVTDMIVSDRAERWKPTSKTAKAILDTQYEVNMEEGIPLITEALRRGITDEEQLAAILAAQQWSMSHSPEELSEIVREFPLSDIYDLMVALRALPQNHQLRSLIDQLFPKISSAMPSVQGYDDPELQKAALALMDLNKGGQIPSVQHLETKPGNYVEANSGGLIPGYAIGAVVPFLGRLIMRPIIGIIARMMARRAAPTAARVASTKFGQTRVGGMAARTLGGVDEAAAMRGVDGAFRIMDPGGPFRMIKDETIDPLMKVARGTPFRSAFGKTSGQRGEVELYRPLPSTYVRSANQQTRTPVPASQNEDVYVIHSMDSPGSFGQTVASSMRHDARMLGAASRIESPSNVLTAAKTKLAIEGRPPITKSEAGEARFAGGTPGRPPADLTEQQIVDELVTNPRTKEILENEVPPMSSDQIDEVAKELGVNNKKLHQLASVFGIAALSSVLSAMVALQRSNNQKYIGQSNVSVDGVTPTEWTYFNTGNQVPGVGNKDTVPAMLTPGEFVVNKDATSDNLPLLHAINNGNYIKANSGGLIPGIQYLAMGGMAKMMAAQLGIGLAGGMGGAAIGGAMGGDTGAMVGSFLGSIIPGLLLPKAMGGIMGAGSGAAVTGLIANPITGPIAALVAAIIATTYTFYKMSESNQKEFEAGRRLADAMTTTSSEIDLLGTSARKRAENMDAYLKQEEDDFVEAKYNRKISRAKTEAEKKRLEEEKKAAMEAAGGKKLVSKSIDEFYMNQINQSRAGSAIPSYLNQSQLGQPTTKEFYNLRNRMLGMRFASAGPSIVDDGFGKSFIEGVGKEQFQSLKAVLDLPNQLARGDLSTAQMQSTLAVGRAAYGDNALTTKGIAEKDFAAKLSQYILSGVMTQDQASSVAAAIGKEIKDSGFGQRIANEVVSTVGAEGRRVETDPGAVARQLTEQSQRRVDEYQRNIEKLMPQFFAPQVGNNPGALAAAQGGMFGLQGVPGLFGSQAIIDMQRVNARDQYLAQRQERGQGAPTIQDMSQWRETFFTSFFSGMADQLRRDMGGFLEATAANIQMLEENISSVQLRYNDLISKATTLQEKERLRYEQAAALADLDEKRLKAEDQMFALFGGREAYNKQTSQNIAAQQQTLGYQMNFRQNLAREQFGKAMALPVGMNDIPGSILNIGQKVLTGFEVLTGNINLGISGMFGAAGDWLNKTGFGEGLKIGEIYATQLSEGFTKKFEGTQLGINVDTIAAELVDLKVVTEENIDSQLFFIRQLAMQNEEAATILSSMTLQAINDLKAASLASGPKAPGEYALTPAQVEENLRKFDELNTGKIGGRSLTTEATVNIATMSTQIGTEDTIKFYDTMVSLGDIGPQVAERLSSAMAQAGGAIKMVNADGSTMFDTLLKNKEILSDDTMFKDFVAGAQFMSGQVDAVRTAMEGFAKSSGKTIDQVAVDFGKLIRTEDPKQFDKNIKTITSSLNSMKSSIKSNAAMKGNLKDLNYMSNVLLKISKIKDPKKRAELEAKIDPQMQVLMDLMNQFQKAPDTTTKTQILEQIIEVQKSIGQQVTDVTSKEPDKKTGGGGGAKSDPLGDQMRSLRYQIMNQGKIGSILEATGEKVFGTFDRLRNKFREASKLGFGEGVVEYLKSLDPKTALQVGKEILKDQGKLNTLLSLMSQSAITTQQQQTKYAQQQSRFAKTISGAKSFSGMQSYFVNQALADEEFRQRLNDAVSGAKNNKEANKIARQMMQQFRQEKIAQQEAAAAYAPGRLEFAAQQSRIAYQGTERLQQTMGLSQEDAQIAMQNEHVQSMMLDAMEKGRQLSQEEQDAVTKFLNSQKTLQGELNKSFNELKERLSAINQVLSDSSSFIDEYNIKPLQKQFDALTDSNAAYQEQNRRLQNSLSKIQDQEDDIKKSAQEKEKAINDTYNDRIKALDDIQRANNMIAAQQKGQLDVASALSRGDIAGAAQAALSMQQTMAQQRVDATRTDLTRQRDDELEAIRLSTEEQIKNIAVMHNGELLNREQIEQRLKNNNDLIYKNSISQYDLEQKITSERDKQQKIAEEQAKIDRIVNLTERVQVASTESAGNRADEIASIISGARLINTPESKAFANFVESQKNSLNTVTPEEFSRIILDGFTPFINAASQRIGQDLSGLGSAILPEAMGTKDLANPILAENNTKLNNLTVEISSLNKFLSSDPFKDVKDGLNKLKTAIDGFSRSKIPGEPGSGGGTPKPDNPPTDTNLTGTEINLPPAVNANQKTKAQRDELKSQSSTQDIGGQKFRITKYYDQNGMVVPELTKYERDFGGYLPGVGAISNYKEVSVKGIGKYLEESMGSKASDEALSQLLGKLGNNILPSYNLDNVMGRYAGRTTGGYSGIPQTRRTTTAYFGSGDLYSDAGAESAFSSATTTKQPISQSILDKIDIKAAGEAIALGVLQAAVSGVGGSNPIVATLLRLFASKLGDGLLGPNGFMTGSPSEHPKIIDTGKYISQGIVKALGNAIISIPSIMLTNFVNALKTIFGITDVSSTNTGILGIGKSIIGGIFDGLLKNIVAPTSMIGSFIKTIAGALGITIDEKTNMPSGLSTNKGILGIGTSVIQTIFGGISSFLDDPGKTISDIADKVFNKLKEAFSSEKIKSSLMTIGKSIWESIKEGILAVIPDSVKGAARAVMGVNNGGEIKRAFGGMINYKGSREQAPGMMYGGRMKRFATGAFVPGIGSTDKVPALLTPGEFVVRKSVAQENKSMLENLNSQIYPQMANIGQPRFNVPNISQTSISPDISTSTTNKNKYYQVNPMQYNYNINVSTQSNASADDIANTVIYKIRTQDARNVRGGRLVG